MEITLEQSLASVIRFIQDNTEEGTKLYFDEIPESFYVPSVYFPVPYTAGRKVTLHSYNSTTTINCWFMERKDWDAQARASSMMDCIMLNDCVIPVVDRDGAETGMCLRVTAIDTRRIDEGIVQLAFSFDSYFHPEEKRTKMQKFHIAWKNTVENFNEQEVVKNDG